MVIKSLSFFFFFFPVWEGHSLSFFKDIFLVYYSCLPVFIYLFIFRSTLKWSNSLLSCYVAAWESIDSFMGFVLFACGESLFLDAFKILFLSWTFDNLIRIYFDMDFFEFFLVGIFIFSTMDFCFLSWILEVLSHFLFLSFFFKFFWLDNFKYPVFMSSDFFPSVYLSLLLNS